jgi:signal transduction protein with GAF and PtsI domain
MENQEGYNTKSSTFIQDLKEKLINVDSIYDFSRIFIWSLSKYFEASQGAFFIAKEKDGIRYLDFTAGYAYHIPDSETVTFEFGEGLSGQVAKSGKVINLKTVPEGYITILSGLGSSTPKSMLIYPVVYNEKVVAVFELASFKNFEEEDEKFILQTCNQLESVFLNLLSKI